MRRNKSQYAKLPLRKVTDFSEIHKERSSFLETLLVVVFLAVFLNYFTDVLFELINPSTSNGIYVQLVVSLLLLVILFLIIVKWMILRPIELRTTFYSGVLMNPDANSFHRPTNTTSTNVQALLFSLKQQNQLLEVKNFEAIAEILQYTILRWYALEFSTSWLPTPKLVAVGSVQTLGVENLQNKRIFVPKDVEGFEANSILAGNRFPGFEVNIPPGTTLTITNEESGYRLIFSDKHTCTIRVSVYPTGSSMLYGYEASLPSGFDFPDILHGWHFANHHISIEAIFPEPLLYRLGVRTQRPPLEYYYIWARKLLEGLERDFCYPLPFKEQHVDWVY